MNTRNTIDIYKGIGILLMMLAHCLIYDSFLHRIILSFNMPMFFVLAGYTFNCNKYRSNISVFVQKSWQRLIIPYWAYILFLFAFWWLIGDNNIIYGYRKLALSAFYFSGVDVQFNRELSIFAVGAIWFLGCLFWARNLFAYIYTKLSAYSLSIQACIFSTISLLGVYLGTIQKLPWSFDVALAMQYLLFIGLYLKKVNFLEKLMQDRLQKYLFLLAAIVVLYFNAGHATYDSNLREYGNPLLTFNVGVLGSIMSFLVANYINEHTKVFSSFFAFCGKWSLHILVIETLDLYIFKIIWELTRFNTIEYFGAVQFFLFKVVFNLSVVYVLSLYLEYRKRIA